jgi:hypothetical protein
MQRLPVWIGYSPIVHQYGNFDLTVRINFSTLALAMLAATLPEIAHAQQIPAAIAILAISPIIVLALAIGLGVVTRNWMVGGLHVAIVSFLVMLFAIASYWVENDIVIWTPIALLVIQAVILVVLIAKSVLRRTGS